MKSNYGVAILVLSMTTNVLAGPRVNLLATGLGPGVFGKMSSAAIKEFESLRSYARLTKEQAFYYPEVGSTTEARVAASHGATSSMSIDHKLNVLADSTNAEGRNTAILQQMAIDDTGKMTRSAFEIPATSELPTTISLTNSFYSGGGGANEIVSVKRTFAMPNSHDGKLELKNEMHAKQLADGNTYATVLRTSVRTGDSEVVASINGNGIQARQIDISFRTNNPNDYRIPLYNASGHFQLPDQIKGQLVQVNINVIGNRLTFRTTEGIEYVYSIEKDTMKDQRSYNQFIFTQVSKTKMPGGVKSMLAQVKIYPARASAREPVRGMEVESVGAVK